MSAPEASGAFLMEIYERSLRHFGHRRWWPGDTPFEVVIGAILTQNTNWGNVKRAIDNLKAADLLTPDAILAVSDDRLGELIRPSGYYHQKALKLKRVTAWWLNRPDAAPEELRRQLLAINGVGPETADSILLYALYRPYFVIDAYTRRICSRIGIGPASAGYDAWQRLFHERLEPDVKLWNDFHAQFVALGKDICRTRPLCTVCPLNDVCVYGGEQIAGATHPETGGAD